MLRQDFDKLVVSLRIGHTRSRAAAAECLQVAKYLIAKSGELGCYLGCSLNMMLRDKGGAAILVNVSPELLPAALGESQGAYRQHGKRSIVLPARTRLA